MGILRLMDKILHDPKDPELWELWYIPYYGSCRILSINRSSINHTLGDLLPFCRGLEGTVYRVTGNSRAPSMLS